MGGKKRSGLWWLGLGLGVAGGLAMWRHLKDKEQLPSWVDTDARGKVALITGGSSGIGAAFAQQLAVNGFDLVLVARRLNRLQALADSIKAECEVEVKTLVADLGTDEGIGAVETRIGELDNLGLLITMPDLGPAVSSRKLSWTGNWIWFKFTLWPACG